MSTVKEDIAKEVISLLREHKEEFVNALSNDAEFGPNDIRCLQSFNENVDPSFCLEDAVIVLRETEHVGDSYGDEDPENALIVAAIDAYRQDVWAQCKDLYCRMHARMTETFGDHEDTEAKTADQAFDEIIKENASPDPNLVEEGSEEELFLVRSWIRQNDRAGTWGGFPVGGSYIDSRCGSGYSMIEISDYVDFDHEFSKRVPWLAGKRKADVIKRFDTLVQLNRAKLLRRVDNHELPDLNDKSVGAIIRMLLVDLSLTPGDLREIASELNRKAGWHE
jgi:hypothetical protein